MFQTKVVEKIKTHILYSITFFFFKLRPLWDNFEKYITARERQVTIWRMCIACWIHKATNTNSEYVVLIAFPLQQWFTDTPQCYVKRTVPDTLYSYVYWTVHHLDSWIKRDQLDVTWILFHYLLLNMLRMLIHPSSGACDLFVELLHGLYCSHTTCVGVTVWFGWGGVVSGCRLKH